MSGFYLITRGITSHPLFKGRPERLAVWMWLMDNVAWQDTKHDVSGKIISVPRGSVCASPRHIAKQCGVGHQVVRTALKRFESEQMVNTNITHGKSVISLCNYEKHQQPEKAANTALTQHQHSTNTQKKQGNKETTVEDTNVSLSVSTDVPCHANDLSHAVSRYNQAAERAGWPQVQKLTPNRSKQLKARLKDCGGLDGWEDALRRAFASDFCRGRTSKPWTGFGFDWLTKTANFTKLMEGNYDNRVDQLHGEQPDRRKSNASDGFAAVAARYQNLETGTY